MLIPRGLTVASLTPSGHSTTRVCYYFSFVLLPKGFAVALGEPSPPLRMKVANKCKVK